MPPAHTLLRRVGKYAFAALVPARPCPVFGRPVHQRGGPLDYGPVLLLKPFRFRLTADTLPSGCLTTVKKLGYRLGCFHRFRLRARLGFSLSLYPGQRGITPAFGYGAPYPNASGTLTHLIWALLNTHYGGSYSCRSYCPLAGPPTYFNLSSEHSAPNHLVGPVIVLIATAT